MQVVLANILRDLEADAVDGEPPATDAVGAPAHRRAEVRGVALHVALEIVEA